MISRFRFVVTTAFIGCLFHVPLFATGQLLCPPRAHSKDEVTICAVEQEKDGPIFKAHVRVKIDYRDFTLWSDEAAYNSDTGDVTLNGHVALDGGPNDEHVKASHGTYNVQSETGRFYDVVGTIGYRRRTSPWLLLTSSEPFAFSGKIVDKTGPDHYVVYDGTVTTCKLPHPKWQFNTHRAVVTAGGNALIYFSNFRVRGIPLLYFPFATHPVDRSKRQSGLLMPRIGNSSSKGMIWGDSFYWAINRSMDAEIGAEYFSRRGWAQRGDFRARPGNSSYLNLTYFGVMDRGIGTPKVSQGGEQVRFVAVGHIGHNFRAVTDVDYLSSFLFRVAFYDVFNQGLNSGVRSQAFLSNTTRGFSYNAFAQRYQNFQSINKGDVITILHTPSFDFSSVDRELGKSHFYWGIEAAAEGLYRSEPSFRTPRLVGRFDANPSLSLPLHFGVWSLRPEVGIRDTLYTEQLGPSSSMAGPFSDPINRKALETTLELRPPVLERIFDHEVLGRKLKHVIEPRVVYRRVMGVDNFSKILRFDERDILSDTNEVEYGIVTRLFAKRRPSATENCSTTSLPSPNPPSPSQTISLPWEQPGTQPSKASNCPVGPPARELVSWELAQKYFLDTNFGGALVSGTRNVFTTTADFTAIAFLTSPRHLSPLISRLRIQPGSNVDAEWDLSYDFSNGKINASTAVLSYNIGQVSFAGGDTYLRIPGEASVPNNTAARASFHQFRMQLGYGRSNKRGLSGATAFGFDANLGLLQYSAVQTTYNWDCCGITMEYRRFALGTVRNDNQYLFTYSLANIGSFGNLLRKERLY